MRLWDIENLETTACQYDLKWNQGRGKGPLMNYCWNNSKDWENLCIYWPGEKKKHQDNSEIFFFQMEV